MAEMREKANRGQTILSATSPDKSSHKVNANEAMAGRSMSGSGTDTSKALKPGGYNDEVKKGNIPQI